MRTKEIEVYTFDELDEDSKQQAREWYREGALHYEWWDSVYEDAKRVGALLGITIEEIYFSGFYSQGDGACFIGTYEYRKGWKKVLRSEVGGEDLLLLENIGQTLQDHQKRHFRQLTAVVRHEGRHSHERSTDIDVDFGQAPPGGVRKDTAEAEEGVAEALRDFMLWIYDNLKREYEYRLSDEVVDEEIWMNEYEFTVDGSRTAVI